MSWAIGLVEELTNKDKVNNTGIGGAIVGNVVGINPLKISIINGTILLDETIHDLYICNQLLETYTRDFKGLGSIDFKDSNCGTTAPNGACDTAGPHTHNIQDISINTNFNFDGEITFTDTLIVGDNLMLMPDESGQVFFIIDKIKQLGSD